MKDIPSDWYDADSLGNYTFVFPFEIAWNRRRSNDWVRRNWTLSILAAVVYVVAIVLGERLMRRRKQPFQLRTVLTGWNSLLAIFSILGFVRTSPEFFRALTNHGFVHSVCQTTYAQDIVFDFWLLSFVASKFVELFDTAFVVLRRRPLTFLHCYHHITVLLYCWHGGKELTAAGRWFCWMNYGVHSVMYTYYAVRSLGFRVPRPVSISVTSLQLTQMVFGCVVVCTVYKTKTAAWNAGLDADVACHQSWENLYFCFAIYFSYFLLFLRFFIQAYILRGAVAPKCEKVEKAKEQTADIVHFSNGHVASNGYGPRACTEAWKKDLRFRRDGRAEEARIAQQQFVLERLHG